MAELNEEVSSETNEAPAESTDVSQTEGQENVNDPAPQGEVVEGEQTPAEETQDELEFVEQDGKKLIPKERFDQINERMKKAEADAKLLETLRSDPEAAEQFMREHGIRKPETSPAQVPAKPTVDPVGKFIAESVPEESRPHYEAFVSAIEAKLDGKYGDLLEKQLAPYRSFIGDMVLKEARTRLKDFDKYSAGITRRMTQNPNLTIDEAYQLESYKDRFNVGKQTGIKAVEQHKQKINKAPVNKNPNSSSSPAQKKAGNFSEAFDRAWDKVTGTGA